MENVKTRVIVHPRKCPIYSCEIHISGEVTHMIEDHSSVENHSYLIVFTCNKEIGEKIAKTIKDLISTSEIYFANLLYKEIIKACEPIGNFKNIKVDVKEMITRDDTSERVFRHSAVFYDDGKLQDTIFTENFVGKNTTNGVWHLTNGREWAYNSKAIQVKGNIDDEIEYTVSCTRNSIDNSMENLASFLHEKSFEGICLLKKYFY